MSKAKTSLQAAVSNAVKANKGYQAVSDHFLVFVLSKAARRPLASFTASSTAQKCM